MRDLVLGVVSGLFALLSVEGLFTCGKILLAAVRDDKWLRSGPSDLKFRDDEDLSSWSNEDLELKLARVYADVFGLRWSSNTLIVSTIRVVATPDRILSMATALYRVTAGVGGVLLLLAPDPFDDLGGALLIGAIFGIAALFATWWDKMLDKRELAEDRFWSDEHRLSVKRSISKLEQELNRRERDTQTPDVDGQGDSES